MSLDPIITKWSQGWRGPALAALIALVAGLPGVLGLPPLDRDESRFVQATTQMLETGDFVVIKYQDQPRFKKPVGIYWLQAAAVSLTSRPEARAIWAYRIPSLLGAMLAAAACAWGAAAFFGSSTGLIAGATLAVSFLLSTEASIAKTDAVLCGTTTLALAAMGRLYAQAHGGSPVGWRTRLLFWLGLSSAVLVKGPIGLLVVILTGAALWIWDRKAPWLKSMGWGWGLVLMLAVVGPWAGSVTVATDGAFWTTAIAGDLAPKLVGGQESHGAWPGYHLLAAPLMFFPATLLLPAALVLGWQRRNEPGIRFALAWLIPAFLMFEITPTKLVHYPLPTYGALAWLVAASLSQPISPRLRWAGAGLGAVVGLLLAGLVAYLVATYGDSGDRPVAIITALLLAGSGLLGAALLVRDRATLALVGAGSLAILGHGTLTLGVVPSLEPLLISTRTAAVLEAARLLPRQGIAPAPIAVAGYAEPSLVFALGTTTDLGDAQDAVTALAEHRPAIVESREQARFQAGAKALGLTPDKIGEVKGTNYSNGDETDLSIYAPEPLP